MPTFSRILFKFKSLNLRKISQINATANPRETKNVWICESKSSQKFTCKAFFGCFLSFFSKVCRIVIKTIVMQKYISQSIVFVLNIPWYSHISCAKI